MIINEYKLSMTPQFNTPVVWGRQYSNTSDYVEFTYFNDNLWAKINGGSQFAIAKKE